jgi:hypothetical protein
MLTWSGNEADRDTCFRDRTILNKIEQIVKGVRGAILSAFLLVILADVELVKAKLERVRFHGRRHHVAPGDRSLGKVTRSPVSESL